MYNLCQSRVRGAEGHAGDEVTTQSSARLSRTAFKCIVICSAHAPGMQFGRCLPCGEAAGPVHEALNLVGVYRTMTRQAPVPHARA